ncbi:MAG: hypothetical protein ACE148_15745 [Vicinamibacterales bacterium]
MRLRIGSPGAEPLSPAPGGGVVQVWQDEAGVSLAYGWADGRWLWIGWPGVAAFRFSESQDDTVVSAFPDRGGSRDSIEDVFSRIILPIALQARGFEALHASAVVMDDGAVAFCARTKTGKSTLAHALANRGCAQLADDAVVLEFGANGVTVVPLPFLPRLKSPRPREVGAGHEGAGAPSCVRRKRVPLRAVVLMNRSADDSDHQPVALVERLGPSRAFPSVLAHAHCFDLAGRDSRARLLERYLDLVETVPVLDLTFRPGLDLLPAVVDVVVHSIGTLCDAANAIARRKDNGGN